MVSELFSVYTVGNRISLALNISNIKLGLDKAIPCGLLLNEMITNALKHAFPDNRKGTIQIDFHKTKKNNYELTVKDNGVGLPVQVDIKNTRTLGLQLIHILTDQINVHLTVENKKGTSFKVRFENAA